MTDKVEYYKIDIDWSGRLAAFFKTILDKKDDRFFHPHAFTAEKVEALCRYKGRDLYLIQTVENQISGYGMLRGWDEGYTVPSLGIIIHPDYRGRGLAKKFIAVLHDCARQRGANRIRLTVYPENKEAIALYTKMGYAFNHPLKGEQQQVGYVNL